MTGAEQRGRLDALPFGVAALAVLAPVTAFLVFTWLMGWTLQSVLTDSMAPTFPEGSLLVVEPIDPSDVAPGMAVMFADPADPGRLVTHRVVRRAPGEELAFITRGDANATADPLPVPARSVRGHVRWHVGHAGAVLQWFAWPRNLVLLVGLPAALLVVTEARARRQRRAPVPPLVEPTPP